MKKLFTILIASVLVMHCNQSMNVLYWMAVIAMLVSAFKITNKLDSYSYGRTEGIDKKHV